MPAKKPATPPTQPMRTHLENTSITVNSAANEHTRAAVEALANAAARNAEALIEIARALRPGETYGIYVEAD